MATADEIDISKSESLQPVLQFLKGHFPESLSLWQFLDNIQRNLITKEHIWPHQLFLNDRDQIKCVLMVYSTIGFRRDYHEFTDDEKRQERYVSFFCDSESDHILISMLEQYVAWSTTEKIVFFANPHRWSPVIESFIRDHDLGESHVFSSYQMELEKETFDKNKEINTGSYSSDIVIRPLTVSDAVTVNDLWPFKSKFSLPLIVYQIEHFPTVGAYCDETLVSWFLTQYNGSVGMAFTQPEARRRGIAFRLDIDLASKVFESQDRVFAFVSPDNTASLTLLEKIGYRRTCNIDWLHLTSKSTTILEN